MAALAVVVFLSLACSAASAKMVLRSSFESPGLPAGVAVDQASHDIYVGRIFGANAEYDPAGNLLIPPSSFYNEAKPPRAYSGIAVDPVSRHVYSVHANALEIDLFDPALGSEGAGYLSSIPVPGSGNPKLFNLAVVQIATDASGNVYYPNLPSNEVQEFSSAGTPIKTCTGTGATALSEPTGVAVDALGDVWVADGGNNRIEEFDSTCSLVLATIAATGVEDVTLDSSGDVFATVNDGSVHVLEFNSLGTKIDDFGSGTIGTGPFGVITTVAVDNTSHLVYVTDGANSKIWVFGPPVPIVTTGQASEVGETTATLNGHVDPDTADGGGEVESCSFEYGTTTSYGQTAACSPATPYSTATDVSAAIGGLSASTTYHFRLKAANANGTGEGQDQTFTTFGPPSIDSESSSQARAHTVVLEAQINPFGYKTGCQAQYVDQAQFESSGYANATTVSCTPGELSAGFGDQSASASLSGLTLGAVYHYRFIATNQAGTTTGADRTFQTFGIASFTMQEIDNEGHPYARAQAGGHPYGLTSNIVFSETTSALGNPSPDENVKDIRVALPPGLIGNPTAVARCTRAAVPIFQCPGDAQVGLLIAKTSAGNFEEPIYNLVPPAGDAAEFGVRFNNAVTGYIDFHVRSGGDYGIDADSLNISANAGVFSLSLTVWGVPADASHDEDRFCAGEKRDCSTGGALKPFLSDATSCGPRVATLEVDSWQNPGAFVKATAPMQEVSGCERLDFTPSIALQPDTNVTDSPSGLHVDLAIPQNDNPSGLAEAELKDAKVSLPSGVKVNPGQANGLAACPLITGHEEEAQEEKGEITGINLESPQPANCPEASKIGTVTIETPLLDHSLTGGVYVAQQGNAGPAQGSNPFGSLLALYVAVHDPQSGVVVKLAGQVVADPITGQLTTTFDNNPQLPFSHFKLDFFGGPRAALITPQACGAYTPASVLSPWSGMAPVEPPSEPFAINAGCSSGFSPSFTAGTADNQARAYSPLKISMSRNDSEQSMMSLRFTLPGGLTAKLAGVPRCSDAEANAGHCPQSSRIGTVEVCAGVGSSLQLHGGIYLTGPYRGGPFGVAVIVPAIAGPFNLGNVSVRSSIQIDPHTASVTVVSDPFPQMVLQTGIPTAIRCVNVNVDRPEFSLNPTSCEPMEITGQLGSALGATAAVSTRFQAANCGELPFKPRLSVTTKAAHSRAKGDSLHVSLVPPPNQANIAKVHVVLPKALPSRLSTLKLACPQAQFAANPQGCPAGSFVGSATAHTPLLSSALTGKAIFVSHGGARFPDLDIVIQGEGVTIILTGETFISKTGVTSATFNALPDVPVTRFDLTLPAGPHSALSANGNLCKTKMTMPTTMVGHNGAVIKQKIKIGVSGCHKKHKTHHRRHGKKKRH